MASRTLGKPADAGWPAAANFNMAPSPVPAYILAMNKITRPPSLFDHAESKEDTARLDAAAEAQIAAGRTVDHERVAAWIEARKRGEKLPPPSSGK